jgi:hypothetical protein
VWQHEGLAGLRFGGTYFILQDIDVPAWIPAACAGTCAGAVRGLEAAGTGIRRR